MNIIKATKVRSEIEKYMLANKKPSENQSYVVMSYIKEKYILYEKPRIKNYNALQRELENFIASISASKQPLINGVSGLSALVIAIQIQDYIKNNISN